MENSSNEQKSKKGKSLEHRFYEALLDKEDEKIDAIKGLALPIVWVAIILTISLVIQIISLAKVQQVSNSISSFVIDIVKITKFAIH